MRPVRVLLIVLPLTLSLASCSKAEEANRMRDIQQTFSNAVNISFAADIRADYGDRVMDFGVDFAGLPEAGVLTVTSPELIAGAQVKLGDGGATLSYAGAEVYTGEILPDGLSPVDAVAVMAETWGGGLVTETVGESWNGTDCLAALFRVDDDVDLRTWFGPDGLPVHAEFTFDGYTVISTDFYDMKVE